MGEPSGLGAWAEMDPLLMILPPVGAVLVVLPLKLTDGSGSPCRAIALVEG